MPHIPSLRSRAPRWILAAAAAAALAALPAAAPVRQGSASEVDRLIAEGRRLLDQHKPSDAEGLFAQAAELDPSFKTRIWILRARMDQGGHSNDTLDEIETIARTNDGPDMDYLFGMAYARRAEELLLANAPQAIEMNFADAVLLLQKATAADPERYRDAFLPLARAAWYRSDLDTARAAAEEAQRRYPSNPEAAFELGRVALSQFSADKDDPERASLADHAWETARDAFRRAVELSGEPNKKDARGQSLLGQSYLQLGHAWMWKGGTEEAKAAYAGALSWSPGAVDLAALHGLLGTADLGLVLEKAAPAFAKRFGKSDARDAAMHWWLGYARYADRRPEEAQKAFLTALEKAPDYANAWFYVALARYDLKDPDGAIEALLKGWKTDATAIVAETQGDRNVVAKVEYLIGPCVEQSRFADAAVLAEICAEGLVKEPRHWNNLGFFRREEAIRLSALKSQEERARARSLFEASLEAYERALALAPDDPTYLNDAAVVLHYYLDRDLERAAELYGQAEESAKAKLAAGGLDPETEMLVQTALRDAGNNKRALAKLMDERARGEGKRPAEAGAAGNDGG